MIWRMVGGLAAGLLLVLAWVTYTDAPPPDVADLEVTRASIPDEANLYWQLGELSDSLSKNGLVPSLEPEDLPAGSPDKMPNGYQSLFGHYSDFYGFLAAGRGWTPSRLAQWDVPLARLVEECEVLMRLERCQAPAPKRGGHWDDVSPILGLESHLCIAAGMYRRAGDNLRAAEILLLLHRMGDRVKASRGGLLAYGWGQSVQLCALPYLAALAAADPEVAEMIAAEFPWDNAINDAAVFQEALRIEYVVFSSWLDVVAAARHDYGQPSVIYWLQETRVFYPLVMKPNLTKGLYADYIRRQIGWSELTEMEYRTQGGYRLLKLEFRDLFRPVNIYGRMTASSHRGAQGAHFRRVEYRTAVSAFEALLALRLYHADNNALPEALDALVPIYLPAVPVDYRDGAPIRYSPASFEVGSRGRDMTPHSLDFAKPPALSPAPAP